jgi:hypothetical protein
MTQRGFFELLWLVGEAAAAGPVPMALWQETRESFIQFSAGFVDGDYVNLSGAVKPVSRTHMPLRGEPLQQLRHFLMAMRRVARRIPLDVQLYIFNLAYLDDAEQRARAAVLGVLGHGPYPFQCRSYNVPYVFMADANRTFPCTIQMMEKSVFLDATALLCDVKMPYVIHSCSSDAMVRVMMFYLSADPDAYLRQFSRREQTEMWELARRLGLTSVIFHLSNSYSSSDEDE